MDYWKLVKIVLAGVKPCFDYVFVNFVKLSFFENEKLIVWIIRFQWVMYSGKKVYVLTEAIAERSRAMAIKVVVFVFVAMWIVGWNLEWALPGLPTDASVCVMRELYGSLVLQDMNVTHQFEIWGPLRTLERWVPGCYHMNELRLVYHWLVPYEWAVAGAPRCVCQPCVVIVFSVSHELIFPKLKRLAFTQDDMLWNSFWLGLGLGLWIWYEIGFDLDLDLVLDLENHSAYLWHCDRFEPYVWSINMFKEIYDVFKARMWTVEWKMVYVCFK